jgi:hypothetical protein
VVVAVVHPAGALIGYGQAAGPFAGPANGLAPGVAAMILASCHVQGAKLPADLGKAETIITQLGFPSFEGGVVEFQ